MDRIAPRVVLLLAGLMLTTASAPADPLRVDPATGADRRHYPPDPQADFLHMRLEIDIPDMDTPMFTAIERLRFAPLGGPMRTLTLDAKRMSIERVALVGAGATPQWTHDGMTLQVRFDPPLAEGVERDLRIEYTVRDPVEGMYWSPSRPAMPGRPARAAQLHTQGEPEMNSNWFITHDFPNDRLTTEIIATVPEGYLVSSNGVLALEQTSAGRSTFHFKQDRPHVPYLVTLVVGRFDVVDVGDSRVPMPVYAPPGQGPNVQQTFGATMDMVRLFEERLDEPYPWAKYANVVVWNFGWGGMENTSATTLHDTAVLDAKALLDSDIDGLNSHELAHQWFGDLLTCNSWEHIWLNEGFATYLEALWLEARDGFDAGYLLDMHRNVRGVAEDDRLNPDDDRAWMRPAMVSNLYEDPDDVFTKAANPYPKGASILHMLRMTLGDDVFFRGLREYVDRFKYRTVRTEDFRGVMEEVSGRSLEQFFEQWARRPGTPEVTVSASWDYERGELALTVEQTQRIDAMTPAFAFTLPVLIVTRSGDETWVDVEVTGRRHERAVPLGDAPEMIVVDPYLHVLMTPTLDAPDAWVARALRRGPTVPSRLDAAEALAARPGPETVAALAEALADASEHHSVRAACAASLADLDRADELLAALSETTEPKVRVAVVRALGEIDDDRVAPALAPIASDADESYAVRAAALEGLGRRGGPEHLPILTSALEAPSQHDQVRTGALRGLASLDEPEGLDAAILYTEIGWLSRTRPVAIGAVADLAHHDPERAIDALLPLLDDPEERSRQAAARALAEVGDERALERLRALAQTHPQPTFRELLADSAGSLARRLAGDTAGDDLRERVESLERQIEELRRRRDR
ncbi:MAG: hypothetical protein D6693_00660 [Planctomycetota bacterium]|nr:MAG: hypothetical protein D6693_00660 [Planctomycetota bacterium]